MNERRAEHEQRDDEREADIELLVAAIGNLGPSPAEELAWERDRRRRRGRGLR